MVEPAAATAGSGPKSSSKDQPRQDAFHRTPRRASFCDWDNVDDGLSRKPFALRTATACVPFCTMRAAKKRAIAQGQALSNDADVVARFQLQMTGLQHPGVAEVRVHLSRRGFEPANGLPWAVRMTMLSYLTTVPPA